MQLIRWYTAQKRDLPWRKTKKAYPVWLSEIILQQTRVDQGLPYWHRFISAYPTVSDLAKAPEEEVLRLWQGLGYYSRARNLHAAAKYIDQELGGVFPSTYAEILKLKGVGPYTAAAISSICFNEAKPVVDGNVFRFAARYFGVQDDISQAKTRGVFERLLEEYIDRKTPGDFNQGMMEFGATVCGPSPQCPDCVFQSTCYAFASQTQKELPLKTKKTKVRDRYFHYVVFRQGNGYLLNKREEKDVWNSLFDFFLLEGKMNEEQVWDKIGQLCGSDDVILGDASSEYIHVLSHQKIHAKFYSVSFNHRILNRLKEMTSLKIYTVEEMLNLPKPKLIVNYLQSEGIN